MIKFGYAPAPNQSKLSTYSLPYQPIDHYIPVHDFFMAVLVGIVSTRDLRIEAHHRNQYNKNKLLCITC